MKLHLPQMDKTPAESLRNEVSTYQLSSWVQVKWKETEFYCKNLLEFVRQIIWKIARLEFNSNVFTPFEAIFKIYVSFLSQWNCIPWGLFWRQNKNIYKCMDNIENTRKFHILTSTENILTQFSVKLLYNLDDKSRKAFVNMKRLV